MIRAGEGKAPCETTADKPASLQTSVITALFCALLFSTLTGSPVFSSLLYLPFIPDQLHSHTPPIYVTIHSAYLCVYLQVISGSNLPISRSGKALDPFVRVEMHGIASDSHRKNTHTVKNNCKYCKTNCMWPCWDISRHSLTGPALLLSIQDAFCQQCLTFNFLEIKNYNYY